MSLPHPIPAALGCALVLGAPELQADDWQHEMLFQPSAEQRAIEARGRVFIYDRLDGETVDRAMTEEFDRLEHMMFVRTRERPAEGAAAAAVSDDDGC